MSELSNDTGTPGIGGETVAADDSRPALPSHVDVAHGADAPTWGADPSAVDPDQRSRPESAADFGLGRAAHALGLPAETIDGARAWISGEANFSEETLRQLDDQHGAEVQAELRELWGDNLVPNLLAIDKYLDALPGNAGVVFRAARDRDGRALANNAALLQRMVGAARGSAAGSLSGSLNEQIAAIEKTMRTEPQGLQQGRALAGSVSRAADNAEPRAMTQAALEARARLHWMTDEQLEDAVAVAREFLDLEDEFIPLAVNALQMEQAGKLDDDAEATVRAVLLLARHGIPHVSPTAH